MEQSPSWDANKLLASQDMPRILWNIKVSFFTVIIATRYWLLSYARWIQSTPILFPYDPF
jgi:hypothetical protein